MLSKLVSKLVCHLESYMHCSETQKEGEHSVHYVISCEKFVKILSYFLAKNRLLLLCLLIFVSSCQMRGWLALSFLYECMKV